MSIPVQLSRLAWSGLLSLTLAGGASGSSENALRPAVLRYRHGPVLVEAISRLRADQEGGWRTHVARQTLEELGPSLLPALYATFNGATISVDEPHVRRAERSFLIEVMRGWPRRRCLPAVLELAREADGTAERLVVVELFGELGEDRDLLELARFLWEIEPPHSRSSHVRTVVLRAFQNLLRRAPRSLELGEELFEARGLPPWFDAPFATALGDVGTIETLPCFERMLRNNAPDLEVIEALGRVKGTADDAARERAVQLTERYLSSPEPRVRRQALVTLAELGEPRSIVQLLDGLQDADRQVSRGALLGLRATSGVRLDEEPETWRRWLDRERAWYVEEFIPRIGELSTLTRGEASAFLRESAGHRLYRVPVTQELARVLPRLQPPVLAAACHALSRLGDTWAIDALRPLADHPDDAVRAAARAALEQLDAPARSQEHAR